MFNNSSPDQVSYYVRSLEGSHAGHADTRTISGSSMKRSTSPKPRLEIELSDSDEDDTSEPAFDPLSALVLHSQSQPQELDVARLPSVKPSDSLALIPRQLESSQSILFLEIDKPSVITLKNVVDKRGDRFHITPHREAVIVECPTGGHFVDDHGGKIVRKVDKAQPAEVRCVGDEEVAKFQARGVAPLKVGWRKKSRDFTESGTIEGIEDEDVVDFETELRHRVSKTHTVPLRLVHDRPGVHTVALTSVTDDLHNTYNPSGHSAEKVFNVISRSSARFDCASPVQLLKDRTATIPVLLDGSGPLPPDLEVEYTHKSPEGKISTKSLKVSKRVEHVVVSEPGTYTLVEIAGQCAGSVMEPSSCMVQMVPLPSADMTVTTLHEW